MNSHFLVLNGKFQINFMSDCKLTMIGNRVTSHRNTKKRLAAVARRSLLGEIWKSRNGGKVFGEDRYKC